MNASPISKAAALVATSLVLSAPASGQTSFGQFFAGHSSTDPNLEPLELGRVAYADVETWVGDVTPSDTNEFPVFLGTTSSYGYSGPWRVHLGDFVQQVTNGPDRMIPKVEITEPALHFAAGDFTLDLDPYVPAGSIDPFADGASGNESVELSTLRLFDFDSPTHATLTGTGTYRVGWQISVGEIDSTVTNPFGSRLDVTGVGTVVEVGNGNVVVSRQTFAEMNILNGARVTTSFTPSLSDYGLVVGVPFNVEPFDGAGGQVTVDGFGTFLRTRAGVFGPVASSLEVKNRGELQGSFVVWNASDAISEVRFESGASFTSPSPSDFSTGEVGRNGRLVVHGLDTTFASDTTPADLTLDAIRASGPIEGPGNAEAIFSSQSTSWLRQLAVTTNEESGDSTVVVETGATVHVTDDEDPLLIAGIKSRVAARTGGVFEANDVQLVDGGRIEASGAGSRVTAKFIEDELDFDVTPSDRPAITVADGGRVEADDIFLWEGANFFDVRGSGSQLVADRWILLTNEFRTDGKANVSDSGTVRARALVMGGVPNANGTRQSTMNVDTGGTVFTDGLGLDEQATFNVHDGGRVFATGDNGFLVIINSFTTGDSLLHVDGPSSLVDFDADAFVGFSDGSAATLRATNGGRAELLDLTVNALGRIETDTGGRIIVGDPSLAADVDGFVVVPGGIARLRGTVVGNATLGGTVELFDDSPLTVVGDASLGGELVLNVADTGTAELYQSLSLLVATSLDGTFDTVTGPLVDGVAFAVTHDAAEVLVTPAFFGDADLDGDVDLADFGILRAGFGEAGTWVDADFDQDGDVDLAD
ncbi:MAG: hypothetical protein AAGI46_06255, partial [Planctomycetota bacterium]